MAGLTVKQQRFIDEYLIDANATQAALRAGYSKKTAHSIGQENLKKPAIAEALAVAQQERAERTMTTGDRVAYELALHAFGVLGDFFDSDTGRLLEVHELPKEAQARLAATEIVRTKTTRSSDGEESTMQEDSVVKIKLWDKMAALNMLARINGLYKDKVEHSGEVSLLDVCRSIEADEDGTKEGAA